jgi:hypothetical protein
MSKRFSTLWPHETTWFNYALDSVGERLDGWFGGVRRPR